MPATAQVRRRRRPAEAGVIDDPLWYKDAVIYELHVRGFADSNADGIGDVPGLTSKLDYLQDLGVTALWLLPFYPSPLKDDGYDIADYTDVHPAYGTLAEFREFLTEAHRRGLRVITELVLNHTSDQHPWFQRARQAPAGSRHRNFYVWSDTPQRYRDARIIFKDFEASNWTWDSVAKAYYWHRFYAHQPDLNFDSADVRRALLQVVDFWLKLGVDGLRLDAVPYLYERDGTNCENLPETHAFLKALRRHVEARFRNRMLLAEANQWPEEAAAYFGDGHECHMAFHFPVMPRLFMASRLEERFPIIDILQQTPTIPETAQWCIFLRNHDELTLEMVTDEERDYMYRVYANDPQMRVNLGIRRRLAPLLWNNRRKIELMNGLLLSMPGTPVVYYGDEITMGDNVYLGDRNSVRTPMQWSADRNAGFSRANPQKLYLPIIIDPESHYEAVNVEAQQNNPSSMLWWMKRLIALRKRHKAFGRGSVEFLNPENRKVLVFLRRHHDETIMVVANLSRFLQYVELDLGAFKGTVPVELFGQTRLPPIGELPYLLTLGPHTFHWFLMDPPKPEAAVRAHADDHLPILEVHAPWTQVLEGRGRAASELERLLPAYLKRQRWFGGKGRTIRAARIADVARLSPAACVVLLHVDYADGEPDTYCLPLGWVSGEAAPAAGPTTLARLRVRGAEDTVQEGWLRDAMWDPAAGTVWLDTVLRRRQLAGQQGKFVASTSRAAAKQLPKQAGGLEASVLGAEQSNTSILYGTTAILKLFRRLEAGTNPDLEVGRFLTEGQRFANSPRLLGAVEYRQPGREPVTVAMLQEFVPNEGDAWQYTLDALSAYYERAATQSPEQLQQVAGLPRLVEGLDAARPDWMRELLGPYGQMAQLLGQRTAELHLALGADRRNPAFAPEPFTAHYQRSVYQSMRGLAAQVLGLLRRQVHTVPESARDAARALLAREPELQQRFRAIVSRSINSVRIRCHGDYHLGQVLYTGKDFIVIDFEGEPARPLSERRLKRSPLRDVAGMLRSFHYAAYAGLFAATEKEDPQATAAGRTTLEPWANAWVAWVSAEFLRAYVGTAGDAPFLPRAREELRVLLEAFVLEKAVYEIGYELNSRPAWLGIPLQGVTQLLRA